MNKIDVKSRMIELKNEIKETNDILSKANSKLNSLNLQIGILQNKCHHENVIEGEFWQGGGRYFIPTECLDCGKNGDRYSPEITRSENKKWYATCNNAPTEEDYKKGDEIEKNKIFDNKCW